MIAGEAPTIDHYKLAFVLISTPSPPNGNTIIA